MPTESYAEGFSRSKTYTTGNKEWDAKRQQRKRANNLVAPQTLIWQGSMELSSSPASHMLRDFLFPAANSLVPSQENARAQNSSTSSSCQHTQQYRSGFRKESVSACHGTSLSTLASRRVATSGNISVSNEYKHTVPYTVPTASNRLSGLNVIADDMPAMHTKMQSVILQVHLKEGNGKKELTTCWKRAKGLERTIQRESIEGRRASCRSSCRASGIVPVSCNKQGGRRDSP